MVGWLLVGVVGSPPLRCLWLACMVLGAPQGALRVSGSASTRVFPRVYRHGPCPSYPRRVSSSAIPAVHRGKHDVGRCESPFTGMGLSHRVPDGDLVQVCRKTPPPPPRRHRASPGQSGVILVCSCRPSCTRQRRASVSLGLSLHKGLHPVYSRFFGGIAHRDGPTTRLQHSATYSGCGCGWSSASPRFGTLEAKCVGGASPSPDSA